MNTILGLIDSDSHVVTASPAMLETMPAHFMQLPGSAKSARSAALATQYIYGEMAASAQMSTHAAALFGAFSAQAILRIKLYSNPGRIGLVYDSQNTNAAPKGGKWFHVFAASGFFRSYEIMVIDPDNPAGYHQFSRLVVGRFFTPKINLQPDFSYLRNTSTAHKRMSDGSLKATVGGNFSDFAFEFAHLSESERAQVDVFIEKVGMHRDFLLALRPGHGYKYDFTALVMFSQIPPIQQRYFQAYGASFRVTESLGSQATAVVSPPPPPTPPPEPGTGGEGTENGYWIARLNGKEGVSNRYQVASNGAGIVVALKGQDTLQRSTDYGLTYTEVSVPGLLATDIQWTGQYFCGCDALGFIYYSAEGLTWYSVTNGAGTRLDAISGVGSYLLAGGAKIFGFDIATQTFADHSALAGWIEPGCAAMLYSADSAHIFALSANSTRIYRYEVATGDMISFSPVGLNNAWRYAMALYAHGMVAVAMSNGNLYVSANNGASFSLWLSPPVGYVIHDVIRTRRPELLVIMERADGDTRYRRVFDSLGGAFIELSARLTYAGRQMLVQENSRQISYDIVDSDGGSMNTGINTNIAEIFAIDTQGYRVHVDARIQNGIVTWAATPNFSGKIVVAINNTVFQL
jgi:hypothetical protein